MNEVKNGNKKQREYSLPKWMKLKMEIKHWLLCSHQSLDVSKVLGQSQCGSSHKHGTKESWWSQKWKQKTKRILTH